MPTDQRFKHESLQDNLSIAKYLQALIEGFQAGSLVFKSEGDKLSVRPQGLISLEVEAKRRQNEVKLNLKFRWAEEVETPLEQTNHLEISPAE
ncbi:MAG: amphi-Trp domain-containing protein [Deltaproteobacteria bacterium]|nr:amphi-Trp domain-containing protein [Deltaproteobacteria bacterium]